MREVTARLTDRDRTICSLLFDHQVLTTTQVCEVAFETLRAAQYRLTALYRLRILDRFRPFTLTGSAPYHYVLDELGAAVAAATRGLETPGGFRRDKVLRLAASPRLGHLVGVNGFFTSLMSTARHRPDAELAEWWSERRCGAAYGAVVRPDGFGRWHETGNHVQFFLEYDAGTEALGRLTEKLEGYRKLSLTISSTRWTLFWFPGLRREAGARAVLAGAEVPVATATGVEGHGPADSVWLPIGRDGPRLPLAELAMAGL